MAQEKSAWGLGLPYRLGVGRQYAIEMNGRAILSASAPLIGDPQDLNLQRKGN